MLEAPTSLTLCGGQGGLGSLSSPSSRYGVRKVWGLIPATLVSRPLALVKPFTRSVLRPVLRYVRLGVGLRFWETYLARKQ